MTRRVRIKSKYRRPLDEDQIALAFLMLAKQLREEAEQDAETKPALKRRAA
jgi:hypothetical protein